MGVPDWATDSVTTCGTAAQRSPAVAEVVADSLRAPDPDALDGDAQVWRGVASIDPRNDLEALALAALQTWLEGHPTEVGGPGIGDLAIPVLVLDGENDPPHVFTDDLLVQAIPGTRLVELDDADHCSVPTDQRFRSEVLVRGLEYAPSGTAPAELTQKCRRAPSAVEVAVVRYWRLRCPASVLWHIRRALPAKHRNLNGPILAHVSESCFAVRRLCDNQE